MIGVLKRKDYDTERAQKEDYVRTLEEDGNLQA